MRRKKDRGRPLAIDPAAVGADPSAPAFVARPADAPVYYGFTVAHDVEVDGFVLGKISDYEAEDMDCGDAFVIAPDGSRAGLVWEIGDEARIEQITAPEPGRWGVWAVWFSRRMQSSDDARANLAQILPLLKPKWEASRGA